MPHKVMSSNEMVSADTYTTGVKQLLQKARDVKRNGTIEPALNATDFEGEIEAFGHIKDSMAQNPQAAFAAIETAIRTTFHQQLASTPIQSEATETWNLLDVVSIISDCGFGEAGLCFWLIEELLDSQTIEGCKIVFDYLDSRRERLTARNFKSKSLIILRACNELLKRLSRAEDTVFCGRVFIFLFQSFPLGDKSSVNLRGEYHIDNLTTCDEALSNSAEDSGPMAVDMEEGHQDGEAVESQDGQLVKEPSEMTAKEADNIKFESKIDKPKDEAKVTAMDMNTLYPIFWSLQEYFSMPTKLFNPQKLKQFQVGMSAALGKFKEVYKDSEARGSSKGLGSSKGTKRKRGTPGDDVASSFNPKYLTSRDLFDLEIGDLAFQRHVLVQGLILTDFLLSLTAKAKTKLENMKNKSVLYEFSLGDEDARWATDMKSDIAVYLQQGSEGKFYYRMVDTVLSRDKNWARWKAENCPPFQRNPTPTDAFVAAKAGAQKAGTNKRLRSMPVGSLDLAFLSDGERTQGLEKLQKPQRYTIPTPDSFRGPIEDDTFDVETSKTDEDKTLAANARASKLWRTLRTASKTNGLLRRFDKIEDGNNLQALFEEVGEEVGGIKGADETAEPEQMLVSKSPDLSSLTVEAVVVGENVIK